MNIADRIQYLRKTKGLSQEELADKVGVSRQAVSKWESEQSIPDVEKIILLSNYFGTTTDYLLKGIEPLSEVEVKWNAMIFAVVGTVINAIGLVAAIVSWIDQQMVYSIGIGLIIMLLGTGIFLAGQFLDTKDRARATRFFLVPNVWVLLLIPLSCCFNILDGFFYGYTGILAPIPLLGNSFITFGCFWLIYVVVCVAVDAVVGRKTGFFPKEE